MEYTPIDISKQFPDFAKSSVRRILQELLAANKLIRETRGHYNINDEIIEVIYRKILKIGASCGKKFRKIYAITYEFNDENRESKLLSAIEEKYPNCIAINYNYRDLTDYKGKFVAKGDDIEDYGYAYEKWEDSVRIDQFFPNIEVDEE
jgi:hypothetical protein